MVLRYLHPITGEVTPLGVIDILAVKNGMVEVEVAHPFHGLPATTTLWVWPKFITT